MRTREALALAALAAALTGAQISYTQKADNNATCVTCHREQAKSQPHTPMATALQLPNDQAILKTHPSLMFQQNGFTYTIERSGDQSTYRVSDGKQTLALPIRYAFGAGMQTYVLEHEGRVYESLVSYYPTLQGLSTTMGDESITPRNVLEAMGRELGQAEITSCFGCHTTGPRLSGGPSTGSFHPGLTCERCHPGAQAHQDALNQGHPGAAPKRLAGITAEDTSNFCGNCHRTFDTVVRTRLFGQMNVRFQPYRLALSRCFNGADRRIGCTACHDPHRDLVRNDASYDAKCLACHGGAGTVKKTAFAPGEASVQGSAGSCPVAISKCVSCHMPKTELPGSHTQFTDHMIRIVKPNAPYPE